MYIKDLELPATINDNGKGICLVMLIAKSWNKRNNVSLTGIPVENVKLVKVFQGKMNMDIERYDLLALHGGFF